MKERRGLKFMQRSTKTNKKPAIHLPNYYFNTMITFEAMKGFKILYSSFQRRRESKAIMMSSLTHYDCQ